MCARSGREPGTRTGCRAANRPRGRTLPAHFPERDRAGRERAVEILHEDEALIVVNKPAPLPMHAGGRFYRNTLQHILNIVYHPQKPHPAHRLDANTTGIVLVTRTRHFAGRLQPQFARGTVKKTLSGRACKASRRKMFSVAMRPSARSRANSVRARWMKHRARRRARNSACVKRNADGTTLLEARPLTGRTNQIRVHLWHLGFPVCGDPVYLSGQKIGDTQTLSVADAPLCLHAWKIKFVHPLTRQPVSFTAPPPAWATF